ncbi:MAG: hypothetical protein OXG95_03235 [Chloroflexi bacterium]|nr:hypothetical protein [Chloroflexota bacterium]
MPEPVRRALRLIGNLVKEDGSCEELTNAAIGRRVQVEMVDLGDGWSLPQWRLSDEPRGHGPWQVPGPAFRRPRHRQDANRPTTRWADCYVY